MRLKRGQKRIIHISIILVIVLLVVGYMKFFNGSVLYLSTGMKPTELAKIQGNIIYTFEAKVLMSDAKQQYESVFDSSVWTEEIDGTTFEQYVKDQIRAKMIRVRCMNELAKDKGVVLSRDENLAVKNAADQYMFGLTDEQIEAMGVTNEHLLAMFTDFAIAQKLYDDMVSVMDIEISADDARVINIQYICSETRSDIESAKEMLDSGSSFYTVVNQYNTGDNYEYELKRGEMNEAFENAAFELKSGETSDVVEADGKYYLIKCTSDNDKMKTEVNQMTLLTQKQLEQFNKEFEEYESRIYVEWNDTQWEKMHISANESYDVNFEEVFNEYLR